MEIEAIGAIVREKANVHPELRAPLTLKGLRRILEREHVRWSVRRMPRPAKLVPYLGQWTIIIDARQPERQHCYLGAHELGHLWLHHDRFFDRGETRVYNMSDSWEADPEEDDAEIFATMVLQGPEPWRLEPVERVTVPVESHASRRPASAPPPIPRSAQMDLSDTDVIAIAQPLYLFREPAHLEVGDRGEWYFWDGTGRCWRLYDVAIAGSKREILEIGDPKAIARVFIPATGPRFVYRFRRGDRHEPAIEFIERQWAAVVSR